MYKKVHMYLAIFSFLMLVIFTVVSKDMFYVYVLPVICVSIYYSYKLKLFIKETDITGSIIAMKFIVIIAFSGVYGIAIAKMFFM